MARSLLLFTVLLAACGGEPDGVELRSSALEIESGIEEDVLASSQRTIAGAPEGAPVYLGLVEPLKIAQVSWPVPGTVKAVLVTTGDTVKKGQLLAELETESRRAKLAEARKRLGDARAARPGASRSTPDSPPPQWMIDEGKRLQAEAEARAAQRTGDRGSFQFTARREGEEAAVDRAIALAARHNRGRRVSTRQSRRAAEDSLALALVDDLDQRVRTLEDAIQNSRLTSPMDGLIVNSTAVAGLEWNTRSVDPAFEMVDPSTFTVQIVIPMSRAKRLQTNELVWVELPAVGGGTPQVIRARWLSTGENASQLARGTAWVNTVFQLPSKLPRRVFMGEEVRVTLTP